MKRKYEIGFIINPEVTEDVVKKIIDSVVEVIKKGDGTIENIDEWGRRKFAYPIGRFHEGIYVFINTDAPGAMYAALERRLKLTENIIRFIVLRLDDKLKKANRLIKKWQRGEKLARKAQEAGREEAVPRRYSSPSEKEVDNDE